jgi:hypothetical protein
MVGIEKEPYCAAPDHTRGLVSGNHLSVDAGEPASGRRSQVLNFPLNFSLID